MSGGLVTIAGAVCGLAFVLGFVGAGIFLIYRSLQSRKRAEASQGWPSTQGQISESRVAHSTHTDSDGDTSDSYTPTIEYTYQVAGQAYTGRNLTFGFTQGYGNASKAQAVLAKYPVGAHVSVFYDPADPQQAVLERKAGGYGTGMALGIIFLVIGLCLGCGGIFALFSSLMATGAQ
jgi:hypothetical protein